MTKKETGKPEHENAAEPLLTHFDPQGNANMVDVSGKTATKRSAIAVGTISVGSEVMEAISENRVQKGDVLTVAQVAGVMGCKRTAELIPMCHLLNLSHARVWFEICEEKKEVNAFCEVRTEGKTGVEMEALTGVSTALLTIYDMCKSMNKRMCLSNIHLLRKEGGKSGLFLSEERGSAT